MYVASTFRRIMAHLSDELLSSVFFIPIIVSVFAQMSTHHEIVIPWKLFAAVWAARLVYEILCIYVLQALPAQYFLGLKILSTYQPEMGLGLLQITIRVLVGQLKYILGPSIYFMALFHRERQHIGDILAETRVVQIQERANSPKPMTVIASILVFSSLVVNLNESVEFVKQDRLTKQGVIFESPSISIQLGDW